MGGGGGSESGEVQRLLRAVSQGDGDGGGPPVLRLEGGGHRTRTAVRAPRLVTARLAGPS